MHVIFNSNLTTNVRLLWYPKKGYHSEILYALLGMLLRFGISHACRGPGIAMVTSNWYYARDFQLQFDYECQVAVVSEERVPFWNTLCLVSYVAYISISEEFPNKSNSLTVQLNGRRLREHRVKSTAIVLCRVMETLQVVNNSSRSGVCRWSFCMTNRRSNLWPGVRCYQRISSA
jgi:hypothetical protein